MCVCKHRSPVSHVAATWNESCRLVSFAEFAESSNGMVGDALHSIGVDDSVAQWVDNEIEQSLQQTVVRPKAKAKSSPGVPADDNGQEALDLHGYELVDGGSGVSSMTDASKRLHGVMDDAVDDATSSMSTAAVSTGPPQMNRTRRSLAPVNSEAYIGARQTREQYTMVQTVRANAGAAQVPPQALTAAEALDRANPSTTLRDAQRTRIANLYPRFCSTRSCSRTMASSTPIE